MFTNVSPIQITPQKETSPLIVKDAYPFDKSSKVTSKNPGRNRIKETYKARNGIEMYF